MNLIAMYLWLVVFSLVGLCASSSSRAYHEPHCDGRQAIVHLFEWKWSDVAAECERYLGPKEFCGVQISPPNENAVVDPSRPWWERYQPVSYDLNTRSGNEAEFKDMVDRCKAVGVRIYADAVINHMAGSDRSGKGTGGSSFNGGAGDFPRVPYSSGNFHSYSDCGSSGGINYQSARQVRNCDLVGLRDLDHSQGYVQDKVAAYLNKLVDLGVAGFRVDAAKHMWPADLRAIQRKVKDLPEGGRPFFYLEVIDWNSEAVRDDEYFGDGYVTEFRYEQKVKEGLHDLNRLRYVQDSGWSMTPSEQALVFVDNHDSQRQGGKLNYKNGDEYKRAVAFTLANDYGFVKVMSSYSFYRNDQGPPHESDKSIKSVTINDDGTCGNGWVCEHRWNMVGNLVRFRNAVHGERVINWTYGDGVLSFSRGNKGFFAMGFGHFIVTRSTGLPAGEYCDLVSDCAKKITVDASGRATVSPADSSEPFVAITLEEKSESTESETTEGEGPKETSDDGEQTDLPSPVPIPAPPTVDESPNQAGDQDEIKPNEPIQKVVIPVDGEADFQRTVIVIEKETRFGQNVFIRGGLDSSLVSGCTKDVTTSPCSIPIRHVQNYDSEHYVTLNAWRQGDNFLDWSGPEPGQGEYEGKRAGGTPAFWSTGDSSHQGFSELNKWGDHYWIVDIEMNCNRTIGGYFEVRAVVSGLLERRFRQPAGTCQGDSAPATVPFESQYHIARCGYLNVFRYGKGECEIESLN